MATSIEQVGAELRRILTEKPGPEGRDEVARRVGELAQDGGFVSAYVGEGTPARKVLYEDADLGFCLLAHAYEGASESSPHDHGPSWAIYAQVAGETQMTEWEVVEPASEEVAGKVRRLKTYTLQPGMAQVYNEGQLHSPRRESATRLLRVEGRNMDNVRRLRYEPID